MEDITWAVVVEEYSKAHRSCKVHKVDVYHHLNQDMSLSLQIESQSKNNIHEVSLRQSISQK